MSRTPASDTLDRVDLAYGRTRLGVRRREHSTVVRASPVPWLEDPVAAVRTALRDPRGCAPLSESASGCRDVVISVCDGTRPQPRSVVLPPILDEIELASPGARVTVLVATGTHRGNTEDELFEMLGPDVLARCDVVNHDARDAAALVGLGVVGYGVPLFLNRRWVEADLRITTGFVEPHFFAGFSGGPKMVAPGLAGLATVLVLHDLERIADVRSTFGVTHGNPVHDDVRSCAEAAPPHLAVDVLLDREQRVTHVFAGELFTMHQAACEAAREVAMQPVEAPFDVVVTTNAGHPLDQNLYQTVKGLSAAARVVRPGGTIILVAECADGLPDHGLFASLLAEAEGPEQLLSRLATASETIPDQWQAQILAYVLLRATVRVYSDGLTSDEASMAMMTKVDDLEAAVDEAVQRSGPAVCYLPEGPMVIPFLREDG
jgi:nickel-dependent lactate racemase